MPRPNPDSIDPTKYRTDCGRRKNPTPKPTITPPPMAQVLLFSFSFVINKQYQFSYFNIYLSIQIVNILFFPIITCKVKIPGWSRSIISYRKIAVVVGLLFIIATLTPILSAIPLSDIPLGSLGSNGNTDYLTVVSTNQSLVLIGIFLLLVMTAAIVSIPILMYPILKRHNEILGLGYVGSRIFEAIFSVFNIIGILSILSLSRSFVSAGAPAASYFQTQGALLLANLNWGSILLDIPFTIGALVFYYILYKATLVPRWLSGFGLIAAALWLATVPFRMFDLLSSSFEILALPIAVQEMVLAVWLIAKGFNSNGE